MQTLCPFTQIRILEFIQSRKSTEWIYAWVRKPAQSPGTPLLCSTGRCPLPVPSAQLPEAASQGTSEEQCWMLSKCFLSCPIAAIQRWHCSVREHCILAVMGQCSDSCCCPPPHWQKPLLPVLGGCRRGASVGPVTLPVCFRAALTKSLSETTQDAKQSL